MEQAPFEVRERALAETYKELERQKRELFDWEQRLQVREAAVNAGNASAVTAAADSLRTPEE